MGKSNNAAKAWAAYQAVINELQRYGTFKIPGGKNAASFVNRRLASGNVTSRRRHTTNGSKIIELASVFGTPPAIVNPLQRIEGVQLWNDLISMTWTIATDNKQRTRFVTDYKYWFDIFNTEENAEPNLKRWVLSLNLYSETPFVAIPFVATQETDAVITEGDTASSNYLTAIETSISGSEGGYEVLGEIVAKLNPNRDSGTTVFTYSAQINIDLTEKIRKYFSHCSRKEFDGEDPKEFNLGLVIRAEPAQVVTAKGWNQITCSQSKRKASTI
jgi:hypothetical protein